MTTKEKSDLPDWISSNLKEATKNAEPIDDIWSLVARPDFGNYNSLYEIAGPWFDAYFSVTLKPNLLYYACPKNCTNSIKKMIDVKGPNWERCGIQRRGPPPAPGLAPTGSFIAPKQNFYDKERFFSFGFVRNPYDRFYSTYKMLLTMWTLQEPSMVPMVESFDIFVNAVYGKHYRDNHVKRQIDFVPVDLDPQVNFIGRYENFENDWLLLQEKINHKFTDKVAKIQNIQYQEMIRCVGDSTPPRTMSPLSLKRLRELYHDDFINFGYDFDDLAGFEIT